ncbi:D-serine deaminase-like pyridoxal phosphate-dependent protein [Bradyrhizobium sp. USDA 4341]
MIVTETNQEHGIIALRPGSTEPQVTLPVGAKVRILPNHACATGAQHDRYHVVATGSDTVRQWERFRGW